MGNDIEGSAEAERAAARADRVSSTVDRAAYERLRGAARATKKASVRLMWLQRAADVVVRAVEESGAAACRRGCSHCCHIAVQATQLEAEAIAKFSGRPLVSAPTKAARPAQAETWQEVEAMLALVKEDGERRFTGARCPFLSEAGECTVYEVRPQACRLHFSLGDDDSLCRLDGEAGGRSGGSMFMLNNLAMKASDAAVLGLHQPVADLRDWFEEDRPLQLGEIKGG